MKFLFNNNKYYQSRRDGGTLVPFCLDIPYIRNKYYKFLDNDLFICHMRLDRIIMKYRDSDIVFPLIKESINV